MATDSTYIKVVHLVGFEPTMFTPTSRGLKPPAFNHSATDAKACVSIGSLQPNLLQVDFALPYVE